MKTTKTYEIAIKGKYLEDETSGALRSDLYHLTRGNLRNVCLSLATENLSEDDEKIMRHFFKLNATENLRKAIKNYDIEGFRPISNFLKGKNKSIQSFDALELIALIIDFTPRPYNKYRVHNEENIRGNGETETENDVKYPTQPDSDEPVITLKPKNKKMFFWFSTATAATKLSPKKLGIVAMTIGVTASILTRNEYNWMEWQLDHYAVTQFDPQKFSNGMLKKYKREHHKNFKKIDVDCTTKFFNTNNTPKIWYGENAKGKIEFFTATAPHPETGAPLKAITHSAIKKYICNSYQ